MTPSKKKTADVQLTWNEGDDGRLLLDQDGYSASIEARHDPANPAGDPIGFDYYVSEGPSGARIAEGYASTIDNTKRLAQTAIEVHAKEFGNELRTAVEDDEAPDEET
jgi:hypothetical protein